MNTLTQIRQLTEEFNDKLKTEFPADWFRSGGDLFLGNCYGNSNRIYLGLNPGGDFDADFNTALLDEHFWDIPNSGFTYWNSCRYFIKQGPGLHEWFEPATSTFCSPWRTKSFGDLIALNRRTGGKLLSYSGAILRTLIEHHRNGSGVILVVAGVGSLNLVADAMGFRWQACQQYQHGYGIYQWSKVVHRDMVVYQLPHFSWANGRFELGNCARWLAADLNLN